MSWAYGYVDGRYVGYGIPATCDKRGCDVVIDRGLAYCCGDIAHDRWSDEPGCGGFFCPDHLGFVGARGGCQHRQQTRHGRAFCQRLRDYEGTEVCACGIDHPLHHLAPWESEP